MIKSGFGRIIAVLIGRAQVRPAEKALAEPGAVKVRQTRDPLSILCLAYQRRDKYNRAQGTRGNPIIH